MDRPLAPVRRPRRLAGSPPGLWVRLTTEESPVFQEALDQIAEKKDEASHVPILEVFRTHPREVLVANTSLRHDRVVGGAHD